MLNKTNDIFYSVKPTSVSERKDEEEEEGEREKRVDEREKHPCIICGKDYGSSELVQVELLFIGRVTSI